MEEGRFLLEPPARTLLHVPTRPERQTRRHSWTQHHELGTSECLGPVASKLDLDTSRLEPWQGIDRLACLAQRHPRPPVSQELGCRDAAARGADDYDAGAGHREL